MTTFKITLEYDGTRYSGWQIQQNARTIMGEIRKAALQIFDGEIDIRVRDEPMRACTRSHKSCTSR